MFDKMVKMKNKKGFTLIEMLVVIAVIAILVSIIIPTVTGSNQKAAAATNASNLRSVEGEVITMMLVDPTLFGDQAAIQKEIDTTRDQLESDLENIENFDDEATRLKGILDAAEDALDEIVYDENGAHASCSMSLTGTCAKNSSNSRCLLAGRGKYSSHKNCTLAISGSCNAGGELTLSGIEKLLECVSYQGTKLLYNKASSAYNTAKTNYDNYISGLKTDNQTAQNKNNEKEYKLYHFVAENGILTIGDTELEAPPSKAVNTDTLTIAEGQQMVVYVDTTAYQAYAYYPNGTTEYSTADFAAVAE